MVEDLSLELVGVLALEGRPLELSVLRVLISLYEYPGVHYRGEIRTLGIWLACLRTLLVQDGVKIFLDPTHWGCHVLTLLLVVLLLVPCPRLQPSMPRWTSPTSTCTLNCAAVRLRVAIYGSPENLGGLWV